MKVADHIKLFWACLGFLSIIPTGRRTLLTPEEFGSFPAYYPLVGFIFGLDMFILWLLTAPILPARAAAMLVVIFLVVVNRGFHLDGLADAADALFSHKPLEQKLLIMKDSRQGTFGVLAIVLDIMFKVEFVSLAAPLAPWVLILWPVWGRAAATVIAVGSGYVGSDNGLGRWMVEKSSSKELFFGALFCLLASLFGGWPAIFTALIALGGGFAFIALWKKLLGGVTGDLLGATIELTEISSIMIFYIFITL